MSETKRFSVDDILDDIRQEKKGGTQPASPGKVDVDRLVAEIMAERTPVQEPPEKTVEKAEPFSEPLEQAVVKEEIPSVPEPVPATEEPETPEKEKFTVKFEFEEGTTVMEQEPEQPEEPVGPVSTVELLAEAAAEDIREEAAAMGKTPPEPIVRIIPDTQEIPQAEELTVFTEEHTVSGNAPEVDEPTRFIEDIPSVDETLPEHGDALLENDVIPDPVAFERVLHNEEPEEDDVLEYNSPEDEKDVYTGILAARGRMLRNVVLLAVFGGIALALALLQELAPGALPPVLQAAEQPLVFLAVQLVLLIACMLSCSSTIGEGLLSAVRLRPNRDSLLALASLAVLIQVVACFFDTSAVNNMSVHLYIPVVAGAMLFFSWAKLMSANRMILNFRVVASPYDKYITTLLEDENAAMELTRGSVTELPVVAVKRKTKFVTDFVAYSTDEDVSDDYAKYLTPVGLGFAVLLGVVSGIMTGNPYTGLTTAAAVMCVFAPFSYLFMLQFPLSRAAKKYNRDGGVILSPSELDDFSYANAVVVTAHDLFPINSVKLFGIKTFAGQRIDEALMDAASVIRESGSVLTDVFAQIIGGDEKLLRPVDSLIYEDGMGISAWVDNKRVLIGSRELMINHGISVPSRDYEERYLNEGHELIYLSTSGELTAVFLAKFFAAPEVKAAIGRLSDNGIHLVVKSVDAVVTRQKMAEIFDEDPSYFKILPSRLHQAYDTNASDLDRGSGSVLSNGTFQSFVGSLVGAKRLKTVVLLGSILQFAAIGLGLLMMIILTLISGMSEMKVLTLFLYQLVWLVATFFVPRLKSV